MKEKNSRSSIRNLSQSENVLLDVVEDWGFWYSNHNLNKKNPRSTGWIHSHSENFHLVLVADWRFSQRNYNLREKKSQTSFADSVSQRQSSYWSSWGLRILLKQLQLTRDEESMFIRGLYHLTRSFILIEMKILESVNGSTTG